MSKHMTNNNYTELSHSDDCEKYVNQFIQEFPLRSAEIGQGTVIKRALPSRHKRMIGAWCFLDHAGPVTFPQGDGLDVGPHPHIGLQTFTWMIVGTMMHTDSFLPKLSVCIWVPSLIHVQVCKPICGCGPTSKPSPRWKVTGPA